jgi:hypothetical protein
MLKRQHQRHESPEKPATGIADLSDWSKAVADQATPRILKNGQAILLIVGKCPPAKTVKIPVKIWNSDSESSKILLATVSSSFNGRKWLGMPRRSRQSMLRRMGSCRSSICTLRGRPVRIMLSLPQTFFEHTCKQCGRLWFYA